MLKNYKKQYILEKQMIKKTLAIIAMVAISSTTMAASQEKQAHKAVMAAMSANKAAKKVNYEWKNTAKLIKEAEAAAKKGKFGIAKKLAMQAQKQAEVAQKQAKDQASPSVRYQS